MESIQALGENCFSLAKPQTRGKDDSGIAKVVQIGLQPGAMCWLETFSNVMIEGDSHVTLYYLPYRGYGPSFSSGHDKCELIPTSSYFKGSLGAWFKPNAFGGSCGYMLMLGIDGESSEGVGLFTVK